MPGLPCGGRSAGGSVLKSSDACTGGRRAFISETSGVIMLAPRIAAFYGDSVKMDFPASPRKRRFCPVRPKLGELGHSAARGMSGCRTKDGRPESCLAECLGASSLYAWAGEGIRRDLV